ncbi:MAG TPA: hypothetical protein VHS96_01810 [Bacteroidia bacterium]|jgi:hypothetical protein|nr:hypothetical protein [Bacteroidia bacterium]
MKKSIMFILLAVLSLTVFSFASVSKSKKSVESRPVELLLSGNYLLTDVPFDLTDEASLSQLEDQLNCGGNSAQMGFFVRCEKKCGCKFSHATIAGSGCCTSHVENPTTDEIRAANTVRAAVDAIMQKYM